MVQTFQLIYSWAVTKLPISIGLCCHICSILDGTGVLVNVEAGSLLLEIVTVGLDYSMLSDATTSQALHEINEPLKHRLAQVDNDTDTKALCLVFTTR